MTSTDRDEIVAVTVRYCWALDQRRFEDLDQVFAADAVADYGSDARYVGPGQVGAFCAGVVKAMEIDRSQHLVANHQVEITGDTATCRSQYQSHYVLRPAAGSAKPRVMDIGGSYLDALARTEDGWRITGRVARGTWSLGDAPHGAPAAAGGESTAFVVAGWIDVEPDNRDRLMTAAQEMALAASELEEGSLDYLVAADPRTAGRVRVYSRWRSEGDFRGHMDTLHVAAFRRALAEAQVTGRHLRRYVVSEETPALAFALPVTAAGAGS
ncbi:hypothetical protein KNE206_32680 [Kitasatospora sp. NE20-6]|uniref:nuclear transport factor 2 family protein n=1 Tax=Kitasatospora sp. NE20-6 TaxID=2859066 RepID=UPI0034DC2B54